MTLQILFVGKSNFYRYRRIEPNSVYYAIKGTLLPTEHLTQRINPYRICNKIQKRHLGTILALFEQQLD